MLHAIHGQHLALVLLQRSRGRETAECSCFHSTRRFRCCFNGAAVVKPRNDERPLDMGPTEISLQRSRGRETAEWFPNKAERRSGVSSFNGAAVVKPRNGGVRNITAKA